MTDSSFEHFDVLLSSDDSSDTQQEFPPILIGNWKPYRTKEELKAFIQAVSHPIYLALPLTMMEKCSSWLPSEKIVIGSNTMPSVTTGSFTEEVSLDILKKNQVNFVLLDATENNRVKQESHPDLNGKITQLLARNLFPVLCIGESMDQFLQKQTVEVLKTILQECLQEIPIDQLSHIFVIYSSPWIAVRGLSKIKENLNTAYRICRHALAELFGTETAGNIRVMTAVPSIINDYSLYLEGTLSNGFCFLDLASYPNNFLKILASMEKKEETEVETTETDDDSSY